MENICHSSIILLSESSSFFSGFLQLRMYCYFFQKCSSEARRMCFFKQSFVGKVWFSSEINLYLCWKSFTLVSWIHFLISSRLHQSDLDVTKNAMLVQGKLLRSTYSNIVHWIVHVIDSSTPTDTKVNNDLHFHFEGLLMILVRLYLDSIDRNQKRGFCSFCYWSVII